VIPEDVEDVFRTAAVERVAAERNDLSAVKGLVHVRFVLAERVPVLRFHPSQVAAHAQAGEAGAQRFLFERQPRCDGFVGGQPPGFEVPLAVIENRETAFTLEPCRVRKRLEQRLSRRVGGQRLHRSLDTTLVVTSPARKKETRVSASSAPVR
jgi:hypothetical protein